MENVTTLTTKGQVTIPKEIRDKLGLRPYDKIRFTLDDGTVNLEKAFPSLEDVAGSLPALNLDMSVDEAIGLAKEERARATAAKSKRP